VARGTISFRPNLHAVDHEYIEYCSGRFRSGTHQVGRITSGRRFHGAQEVAFAFAIAIAYLEAGVKAGLNIDEFAPRVSWIFNTTSTFSKRWRSFERRVGSGPGL